MWYVVEKANGNEVRHGGFGTAEEACVFVINGGAHNFEWVGTKVTYIIKFEE